jgi:exosortase
LYFAQTQLEVSEACSGLRSMTSLIMLSCLFVGIMRNNWIWRFVMLFSAIPLAILANIVRIMGTGILAHFIGEKAAQGFLHGFSGMAVFVFGLALLIIEFLLIERMSFQKNRTKAMMDKGFSSGLKNK